MKESLVLGVIVATNCLFLTPVRATDNAVLNTARVQVLAQSGCCKEWDNSRRQWRVLAGYSYADREYENGERDGGDDVRSASGNIWWDAAC